MPGDRPLSRRDGLLTEEVDGEVLVYDKHRELVCRLNRSAAIVWRNCDGDRTVDELVELTASELGDFVDRDLVLVALDNLAAHDLIESGYESRDEAEARLSRRRFFKRVGVTGAAAAAIPVVASMVVPTAAAATSMTYPYSYRLPKHDLLRKLKV